MQPTPRYHRSVLPHMKAGFAIALMTATLGFASADADAANVRIRTTADLNVRTCPSTNCKVIGVLPQGTCEVAHRWAAGRTWVEITFRGRRGFVSASYVRRGCR